MKTVYEIISEIGRDVLQRDLGIGKAAISNVANSNDNRFPAEWLNVIEYHCKERGIALDRSLFRIKPVPKQEKVA